MSRGRPAVYPWQYLEKVGDFFIVEESFKPNNYMAALVAQRNYHSKGERRYSTAKIIGGTIVFLAQIENFAPLDMFEVHPGVWAPKELIPGEYIEKREMIGLRNMPTQEDKIKLMSTEEKLANLPWWWDKGKAIVNGKVMTSADSARYITGREPIPGPNVPYPSYYNLDENMKKMPDAFDLGIDTGEIDDGPVEIDDGPVDFEMDEGEFALPFEDEEDDQDDEQ